jgi:tetratricopeptide (TPR) repeat protein
LAALACVALTAAACVEVPRDIALSERGADALEAGDYVAAEQFLGDALEHNPGNEYALLNLGVIYQDTGRPELARRTYAEIIRLNRLERAASTVARRGSGVDPMVLARENLADLNLSPVNVDRQEPPPSWYGNNAPIDNRSFSALYSDMSAVYDKLQALAETMRLMSDTLRAAAEDAERRVAMARAEESMTDASAAPPTGESMGQSTSDGAAGEKMASVDLNAGDNEHGKTEAAAEKASGGESAEEKAVARAEEVAEKGPSVQVHIASFRSEKGAEKGWQLLQERHGELLGDLELNIREIDFGAGMGVFYRVQAGPLENEQAAQALCERLKLRGLYCAVAFF